VLLRKQEHYICLGGLRVLQLCAVRRWVPSVPHHRPQGCDPVGLVSGLVGADTADAREAHGEAGLVALARMDGIEGDFEDEALVGLAHGTEAIDGVEREIHGVEMRAIDTPDLPLLDQFQGSPIALAHNVVAALCDIEIDQVRQLALEDFTRLAGEALWQIEQASIAMGLAADFFLSHRPGERT